MNSMFDISKVHSILNLAVQKYLPEEKDDFFLVGGQILQEYKEGITTTKQDIGDFEFAPSVLQSFQFISLIIGTVKTILELLKWGKKSSENVLTISIEKSLEKVEALWSNKLVEEGLLKEKADLVAKEFANELLKTIIKN